VLLPVTTMSTDQATLARTLMDHRVVMMIPMVHPITTVTTTIKLIMGVCYVYEKVFSNYQ